MANTHKDLDANASDSQTTALVGAVLVFISYGFFWYCPFVPQAFGSDESAFVFRNFVSSGGRVSRRHF